MLNLVALGIVAAIVVLTVIAIVDWIVRWRAVRRLSAHADNPLAADVSHTSPSGSLGRWLSLAGFSHPSVPALFMASLAASLVIGVVLAQVFRSVALRPLVETVSNIPGGVGETLAAIVLGGPWILLTVATLAPVLVVRAARRARVRAIEQDLPLALELFATMAEAGLGFDAALIKIVGSQDPDRPLNIEFAHFQRDLLSGVPRLRALRQLARRIEVTPVTSFTSAVIQAERVGASMAETLRHQADDLRGRRREQALVLAQALPVKLVFPLVVCFLPGIFVSTLAPVIYQMIQVANSVLRSAGR